MIVNALQPFVAAVKVQVGDAEASGHSILGLMSLAAGPGTKVTFTICGKDAQQAMDAVRCLFEEFASTPDPAAAGE